MPAGSERERPGLPAARQQARRQERGPLPRWHDDDDHDDDHHDDRDHDDDHDGGDDDIHHADYIDPADRHVPAERLDDDLYDDVTWAYQPTAGLQAAAGTAADEAAAGTGDAPTGDDEDADPDVPRQAASDRAR